MRLEVEHAGVTFKEIESHARFLVPRIEAMRAIVASHEWHAPEASLNLPTDTATMQAVEDTRAKLFTPELRWVIVVGIGGSNLGAEAVYDAHAGRYAAFDAERTPKLICLDTTDVASISVVRRVLGSSRPDQIAIIVISKSGTTTETLVNAQALFDSFSEKVPLSRWAVISDESSPLFLWGVANHVATLALPSSVGGRYSVMSSVGLLPMSLLFPEWRELVDGAREMIHQCMYAHPENNPALVSAAVLYEHILQGKIVNDSFFFDPSCASLGAWYRQLFGESIGKTDRALLPTTSIGSTDLHSMGQWYLGGPMACVTTFVSVDGVQSDPVGFGPFSALVPGLGGKRFDEVTTAILSGVEDAYKERKRPFMRVRLESLALREIGRYMQFKMVEVMFLASLLKVNAFDQPAVESYKAKTRQLLGINH